MIDFSLTLFIMTVFWGGLALLIFEIIWYWLEKKLGLLNSLPKELLEDINWGYFFSKYIMQLSFLVAIPTAVYRLMYMLLPFYGVRAGVAVGLILFVLGVIPFSISIFMRVKLPISYILFQMAGYLLKLIMIYGIIGKLYVM